MAIRLASSYGVPESQAASGKLHKPPKSRKIRRVIKAAATGTHFDHGRTVRPTRPTGSGVIQGMMITGPLIAEIAALVGEPARATMLSALLDGRALTAGELAYAARVTAQTASTHRAKLTEAGLLSPIRDGRHRYFRLASPKVVEMRHGIVAVALENRPRYRPLSRHAQELCAARICYDHLASRL